MRKEHVLTFHSNINQNKTYIYYAEENKKRGVNLYWKKLPGLCCYINIVQGFYNLQPPPSLPLHCFKCRGGGMMFFIDIDLIWFGILQAIFLEYMPGKNNFHIFWKTKNLEIMIFRKNEKNSFFFWGGGRYSPLIYICIV